MSVLFTADNGIGFRHPLLTFFLQRCRTILALNRRLNRGLGCGLTLAASGQERHPQKENSVFHTEIFGDCGYFR